MRTIPGFDDWWWQRMLIRIMMTITATLLLRRSIIIMIMVQRMAIRRMGSDELAHWILLCFSWTSPFSCWYHFLKHVLLCCSSVSDAAQLQHILFACQRCCCVNYFGDVVWIWCIIAPKCAMSASGPLHYVKSNRWLSATCAICWGDLADFRCNNCQRKGGADQKAISSDSDNITF